MTVRIHSLIRGAEKEVPPVPPVPFMYFVQQPTNTMVNEVFDPAIQVQISDGGSDLLILVNFTGTCQLGFQYAQADSNGLATFNGFKAGPFPSGNEGCTVSVSNLTRPEVPEIISNAFHVTEPPPLPTVWKFINVAMGGATNENAGVAFTNVVDMTGANVFVAAINTYIAQSTPIIFVLPQGGTFTPLSLVDNGFGAELWMSFLFGVTGTANQQFQGVAYGSSLGLMVFGFQVEYPVEFVGSIAGTGTPGNEVTPSSPYTVTALGTLLNSGLADLSTVPPIRTPLGFAANYMPYTPGVSMGVGLARREPPAVGEVQQPGWISGNPNSFTSTQLLVIRKIEPAFELMSATYAESTTSIVTLTVNTIGASLVVIAVGAFFSDIATSTVTNPVIPLTSTPYVIAPGSPALGMRYQSFLNPPVTSANHQFTLTLNSSNGPTRPRAWALVFRATGTVSLITTGGGAANNVTSIQSTTPLDFASRNGIAVSAVITNQAGSPFIAPPGYEVSTQASTTYPLAIAFRFPGNPSTENPVWNITTPGSIVTLLDKFQST